MSHCRYRFTNFSPRLTKISLGILKLNIDILSRSGDIHDQSRRLYKIDRNFACFWPQIFLGEGPPNFWTWIIKFRQFPTMWPSFTAISGPRRTRGERIKKEKTSRAFHKSSRTTVTGGLIKGHTSRPYNNTGIHLLLISFQV